MGAATPYLTGLALTALLIVGAVALAKKLSIVLPRSVTIGAFSVLILNAIWGSARKFFDLTSPQFDTAVTAYTVIVDVVCVAVLAYKVYSALRRSPPTNVT